MKTVQPPRQLKCYYLMKGITPDRVQVNRALPAVCIHCRGKRRCIDIRTRMPVPWPLDQNFGKGGSL